MHITAITAVEHMLIVARIYVMSLTTEMRQNSSSTKFFYSIENEEKNLPSILNESCD